MKPKKYIRILCEGEKTEPNYFLGILKKQGLSNGRVLKPKDNSPFGIVKQAKKEYQAATHAKIPKKDIEIWAVFDRDLHADIDKALSMAKANHINVGYSNICFEFWILLHFEKSTKPFVTCADVIRVLKSRYLTNYEKKANHYEILSSKMSDALNNNNWLLNKHWKHELNGSIPKELNPYTNVCKLVEFLLSQE